MKRLLLSFAIFMSLSFYPNDVEKKTYWLASCVVLCETREVTVAIIVECHTFNKAKIIFETWLKKGKKDDISIGVIDKNTYTIRLITPESILK